MFRFLQVMCKVSCRICRIGIMRLHRRRNIRFPTATGQTLREARPKGLPRSGLLLGCYVSHKLVSVLISIRTSLKFQVRLLFSASLFSCCLYSSSMALIGLGRLSRQTRRRGFVFLSECPCADNAWWTISSNSTEHSCVCVEIHLCRNSSVDFFVKPAGGVSCSCRNALVLTSLGGLFRQTRQSTLVFVLKYIFVATAWRSYS